MSDVEQRLAALEHRVGELEDVNAIRRLHWAYGYYIDFNLPEQVADLFAEDGVVVFLSGEYVGKAGVMRLYGDWIQHRFTGGRPGPVDGLLLDHFQMQDIITVAPTGRPPRAASAACCSAAGTTISSTPSPTSCRSSSWKPGSTRTTTCARTACGRSSGSTTRCSGRATTRKAGRTPPATCSRPRSSIRKIRSARSLLPAARYRKTWPYRHDVPMHFAHPKFGAAAGRGGAA
jgi:hypothetical protein